MIQVDRHTIIQIFGSLMQQPDLLNNIDKYCLDITDFSEPLDKYIFSAIYNLYVNGAERIHSADIDNYLQTNSYAKDLIENENGLSFLQDCENESNIENFDFYYNNLKKINLVRELQLSKNDIDEIYCENVFNERYNEINDNFKKMTPQDIVNFIKNKAANLEKKYIINNLVEESSPADSIEERLLELKENPEIGCMLQGDILNTITRGGRLGKLYLRSAGSGIGKSRSMVGDACNIAYPIRFDPKLNKWVETGSCEKVLYIMTEQDTEEIDTMILAYLTGYNEDTFTYGTFDPDDERVKIAKDIIIRYKDNMNYARIPDPCSAVVKNLLRRRNIQDGIQYFFYDYIFSSPAMLNEYRDLKIREDVALRLFTTTLKNLAVELNAFIMTSTQISNDEENKKGGFRDFRNIQGSRSIVNLVDFACIMSTPSPEELTAVAAFKQSFGYSPNVVTDVFKNRRGRWNQVRIWSYFDKGTCRKYDLFITSDRMKPLNEFFIVDFKHNCNIEVQDLLKLYNNGEVANDEIIKTYIKEEDEQILNNFSEVFGDREDRLMRIKNKGLSELL